MANSLWNSMLEPVGNMTFNTAPGVLKKFLCPTADFHHEIQLLTNSNEKQS